MVATVRLAAPRIAVALPARRAAVADPDRDGTVGPREAARYYEARFALLDRDRDGRVTRTELLGPAAADSRHARGKALVPLDHSAAGSFSPGPLLGTGDWQRAWPAAGADGQRTTLFDLLDADRNGALGEQEFTNAGAEDFAASDADGDGQVTTREFYAGKRL